MHTATVVAPSMVGSSATHGRTSGSVTHHEFGVWYISRRLADFNAARTLGESWIADSCTPAIDGSCQLHTTFQPVLL